MVPVIRSEAGFGLVLLVFCFGLGLYAMKSAIAPAIMSELFPTRLLCRHAVSTRCMRSIENISMRLRSPSPMH